VQGLPNTGSGALDSTGGRLLLALLTLIAAGGFTGVVIGLRRRS